jgi:DNA-binding protein HU-beta
MTKADVVNEIADRTGIEKAEVQTTVEAFMNVIKGSLENGENVYLRGFGSFVIKKRAKKTGRNILKNTTIEIPAHNIPSFKPSKTFIEGVKSNVNDEASNDTIDRDFAVLRRFRSFFHFASPSQDFTGGNQRFC